MLKQSKIVPRCHQKLRIRLRAKKAQTIAIASFARVKASEISGEDGGRSGPVLSGELGYTLTGFIG